MSQLYSFSDRFPDRLATVEHVFFRECSDHLAPFCLPSLTNPLYSRFNFLYGW